MNNVISVKISEFNVSQSISDASIIPFVENGTNLTISFSNLKSALGVTGQIKNAGSPTSVPILSQPGGGVNYIRGVLGSNGITTTLAPTGEISIKTNFSNDTGGAGVVVDPNAQQIKFRSIVGGTNTSTRVSGNSIIIDVEESDPLTSQKIVRSANDFDDPLLPGVQYLLDGAINLGSKQLNIGDGGANISGVSSGVSSLTSTAGSYTMFNGSGSLVLSDMTVTVSGTGSKVFGLTDAIGDNFINATRVDYSNCTSLGFIDGFRQGVEFSTSRTGGSPELTLSGDWGGYRITTSIVSNVSAGTDIFRSGTALSFSGRFITDVNCDLASTGSLFDFAPANFQNDESLIVIGAFVTRNGVINTSDTTIHPNVSHTDSVSNWSGNTGIPNTHKYIKARNTSDNTVALSGQPVGTFVAIGGNYSVVNAAQFDSPNNGRYRLLTGNGLYNIQGSVQIDGNNGDSISLRATLSSDGGATFPDVIETITTEIPNFTGGNDFATFNVNFITDIKKGQLIRLEVANNTSADDVVDKTESFVTVTEA